MDAAGWGLQRHEQEKGSDLCADAIVTFAGETLPVASLSSFGSDPYANAIITSTPPAWRVNNGFLPSTGRLALPGNVKFAFFSGSRFPRNIHPFYRGVIWTAVAPAYHLLYSRACALKHRLDPAIGEIAHPSLYAEAAGAGAGVRPEAHTLYPARNNHARPHMFHGR
jgi:hypothetical protein